MKRRSQRRCWPKPPASQRLSCTQPWEQRRGVLEYWIPVPPLKAERVKRRAKGTPSYERRCVEPWRSAAHRRGARYCGFSFARKGGAGGRLNRLWIS